MSDQSTELTTEFAKELAKQIPVRDALAAPARQTGQILEDIVKTIQLALVPFQLGGALQDRLRGFIDRSVRAVPEANRVSPAPQILGPIIEGIRYEPADTPIDEMFSRLLSCSMNIAQLNDAHPAFPQIIKQISADEAVLLSKLADGPFSQIAHAEIDPARNLFRPAVIENESIPRDGLKFPENARLYIEHLYQLGLVEFSVTKSPEATMTGGKQTGSRTFGEHQLSRWGRQFVRACTSKTPPA
jgi:hypothetical protein